VRESDCQQENEIQTAYRLNKRMPITSIDHGGGKRRGRIAAECTATIWYPLVSFLGILVFVFEHIRQLGDICVTAPNRRPAAIAKIAAEIKIAAQIEYAYSGEVKDDSAEGGEADHCSSVR
jgi:hypothetical protein